MTNILIIAILILAAQASTIYRMYLAPSNRLYTVPMHIGTNYTANFCISTQDVITYVPYNSCTSCLPQEPKYSCLGECTWVSTLNYTFEGDIRNGRTYDDYLKSGYTAYYPISTYFKFLGVMNESLKSKRDKHDCVLGLNLIANSTLNSFFYYGYYSKIIGLHIPHGQITVNAYDNDMINGKLKYFHIITPGNSQYEGWNVQITSFSINSQVYQVSDLNYGAIDTMEPYLLAPTTVMEYLNNSFCLNQDCKINADGYYYKFVGSASDDSANIGNIEISLGENFSFVLKPQDYTNITYISSIDQYMVTFEIKESTQAIDRWVLGNMILNKYDIVLDGSQKRIGVVVSNAWTAKKTLIIIGVSAGFIGIVSLVVYCKCKRKKKEPLIELLPNKNSSK